MSTSRVDPRAHFFRQEQGPAPQTESDLRPIACRTAVIGALFWTMAGPMTLLMSTFLILRASGFWTSGDGFYAAGLAAMFWGRWLEFRSGIAETMDGKPFSTHHLNRYYLLLGLTGLVVWMIASAIRTVWLIL